MTRAAAQWQRVRSHHLGHRTHQATLRACLICHHVAAVHSVSLVEGRLTLICHGDGCNGSRCRHRVMPEEFNDEPVAA